jgi:hypothetical protein
MTKPAQFNKLVTASRNLQFLYRSQNNKILQLP